MEAETDVSEPAMEKEAISDTVEAATDEPEPTDPTTVTTQSDVSESADNTEIAANEPTYSLADMDEIRKWWEIPCVAHFCSLFRAAFDLPDFDIEELEEALLASGTPEGSMLMCDLISQLLNGCYGRNDIKSYNFELYLKDIFKKKAEIVEGFVNPLDESSFQMLSVRTKLELLQEVCDFRLDADDVQDLLKGLDGDNLRVEPMGRDQHGATYWYFYGVRLYKEDPELKPEDKKKKEKKKPVKKNVCKMEEKKQTKSKKGQKMKGRQSSTPQATPERRGKRGRPRKKTQKEEEVVKSEERTEDNADVEDEKESQATLTQEETPSRRSSRRKTPKTPGIEEGDAVEDGEEKPQTPSDVTPSRRTRRLSRKAQEVAAAAAASKTTVKGGSDDDDLTEDDSATEDEEPVVNGEAETDDDDDDIPLATLKKEPVPVHRWHLLCQTLEDWQALAESFKESKVRCEKTMFRTITEDFLPEIPRIIEEKERDMKRRALENAPRRTSCRLEEKQKQREEEERLLALQQAEEDKRRQAEEEERRRILEMEKLEIQKRQREEREKQRERMREERERAVERRAKRAAQREEKARLLAERERLLAEGVELPPELQNLDSSSHKDEDEDVEKLNADLEESYSGMRKILYTIKAHEDSWPFWEPVKEEFAPDYFKVIQKPMDLTTIENKLDNREYASIEDFSDDFQLLFDNCEKYNGETSDFTYMARTLEKIFRTRVRRILPKRVSRYDQDEDYIADEYVSPTKIRPKRQTAAHAMENIHAVMMDQDEDGEITDASKSKYTIIYPALKSRGDDMRTAEGQARFLQALQAAKRKEAAEEFNTKGERSLKIQTNTVTIPKNPLRPVSVEDPVKGIILQNNRNKVQLLAKTVSVTSRYNGQPQQKSATSEEDPELASLPMHKRIKEREAQKALNKLGEPKAEPVNDYISVVRRSDVSRLYSGLIQKTAKQANSPHKYTPGKAPASNISPKVVHISLEDFKRLQSQKAKVICVPSRDAGKSGTVIHLSTGGIRTAVSTVKADSLVNVKKDDQKATPAQGVVPSKDFNVLEHSSDKVTVLKTTPATPVSDEEKQDQAESTADKSLDSAKESKDTHNEESKDTTCEESKDTTCEESKDTTCEESKDTPSEKGNNTPSEKSKDAPSEGSLDSVKEIVKNKNFESSESQDTNAEIPMEVEEKSPEKSKESPKVPKLYVKVPSQSGTPKTPVQTVKAVVKTKTKTTLLTPDKEVEKNVEGPVKAITKNYSKSPKTPSRDTQKATVSSKTPSRDTQKATVSPKTPSIDTQKATVSPKTPVLTPKTIMKIQKSILTTESKGDGATQTENDSLDSPIPRKKLRKSVSWSKNLTTEAPYVSPLKDTTSRTPPRTSCLYKDGIHSRIPRMHAAPLQTTVTKEPEIGMEKTIVNGMIVTRSIFQTQPVIKTYSKKEPERKRSYESDFFLDEDEQSDPRDPSPPKLTRIEQTEGVYDHSEEAPPDIVSDHENDSSQTSDSESKVEPSSDALIPKEISKLHTSLYTYSGGRKRKGPAKEKKKTPPAAEDDDSTCAKVVRRTKRSPQALRQMRQCRVTAPLHDEVAASSSKSVRRPGRPSTTILYEYQVAASRKPGRGGKIKIVEATKDCGSQVEKSETEVQEPVLDLVSEVNMEELEEGLSEEADSDMVERTASSDNNTIESLAAEEKSLTVTQENVESSVMDDTGNKDVDKISEETVDEDVCLKDTGGETYVGTVEEETVVEESEDTTVEDVEETNEEDTKETAEGIEEGIDEDDSEERYTEGVEEGTSVEGVEEGTSVEGVEETCEDVEEGTNVGVEEDINKEGVNEAITVNDFEEANVEDVETNVGVEETNVEDIETNVGVEETNVEDVETNVGVEETNVEDVETNVGVEETNVEDVETVVGVEETNVEDVGTNESVEETKVEEVETVVGVEETSVEETSVEEVEEWTNVEDCKEYNIGGSEETNVERNVEETNVQDDVKETNVNGNSMEEEKKETVLEDEESEIIQEETLESDGPTTGDKESNAEQIVEETQTDEPLIPDGGRNTEEICEGTEYFEQPVEDKGVNTEQISHEDTRTRQMDMDLMEDSAPETSDHTIETEESTEHIIVEKEGGAAEEGVNTDQIPQNFEIEDPADGENVRHGEQSEEYDINEDSSRDEITVETVEQPCDEETAVETIEPLGGETQLENVEKANENDVENMDAGKEETKQELQSVEEAESGDSVNTGSELQEQSEQLPECNLQDTDKYREEEANEEHPVAPRGKSPSVDKESVFEPELISQQDQLDTEVVPCEQDDSNELKAEVDMEVVYGQEEEEEVVELVKEMPQTQDVDHAEPETVTEEVLLVDVSQGESVGNGSSLMETELEFSENTVCENVSEQTVVISECAEFAGDSIEMTEDVVNQQVDYIKPEHLTEDHNQNTDISVSEESLHSEESGGGSVRSVSATDEVENVDPNVISGADIECVAQTAEVSEEVVPMETDSLTEDGSQEVSVQVIDYGEKPARSEQNSLCENVHSESETGSSLTECGECSENLEKSNEGQNVNDSPVSEISEPPVLQMVSEAELGVQTVSVLSASESVQSEVSAVLCVAEHEQCKPVNGTQTAGDTQSPYHASQPENKSDSNEASVVSEKTKDTSCDFKSPSNDPVRKSSKSPVVSSPLEYLQKGSPPRLSHGKSPSGKGSPENSPQKVSPNSSPSKSGCVDRNVFSEFASNVNSEAKTSPTSSPGKSSSSMLNLPRGFAASLTKLKFKLPSKPKISEDKTSGDNS